MHVLLNVAPLFVNGIELMGEGEGLVIIIGAQALYAQAHIGQSTSSINARANSKAQIKTMAALGVTTRYVVERGDAWGHVFLPYLVEALGDQNTIIGIKWHHISHGA